jgi:poly(3-hydroxybutyrate) depolymerase
MRKTIFSLILSFTTVLADEIDFTYDGWDRECYLYKPSCIPDGAQGDDFEPVPLVFMFHGLGGEGEDNYDFTSIAEDSCFMVAFPSGMYNTWNTGPDAPGSHSIDDISYIEALVDTIYNYYPLDTNRIYGTGHSAGGGFANHLACASDKFTALGSAAGYLWTAFEHWGEGLDSDLAEEYNYLCDPMTIGYTMPMIHFHGRMDWGVFVEWGEMSAVQGALRNGCDDALSVDLPGPNWPDDNNSDYPLDWTELMAEYFATADTLEYNDSIYRFQWSNGCHVEPNIVAIIMPTHQHAWPLLSTSPIDGLLEHWNFFRQFSKDEMGPALDSLEINNSGSAVILDDDYYVNGETTPIRILAIDNYSVASMTISFSGFINVEGFDLTITFDTGSKLLNLDTAVVLSPEISTDNYETVQISLVDHDGNEKVYELEELQDLGLYQQMAIMNNITTSTDDGSLGPESYTLHQNYPNPFNPVTTLHYELPEDALINITIYDMMGRIVNNLVSIRQNAGYKSVQWNATNNQGQPVSAGLYLYTIQAGEFKQTKKMLLLK